MCEIVRCKQCGEVETVKPGECILHLLKFKTTPFQTLWWNQIRFTIPWISSVFDELWGLAIFIGCRRESLLGTSKFLFFTLYLSEVGMIIPISQKRKLRLREAKQNLFKIAHLVISRIKGWAQGCLVSKPAHHTEKRVIHFHWWFCVRASHCQVWLIVFL